MKLKGKALLACTLAAMMLAACGGSIGAWCGMQVWHHKTLHKKFKYGIPLILLLQLVLTYCLV